MVVFGQSGCIRAKVDVFMQIFLFGRKRLYSGKNGCIRVLWLCLGRNGCIQAKVVVCWHCGCIWTKVVVLGQSGSIQEKLVVFL